MIKFRYKRKEPTNNPPKTSGTSATINKNVTKSTENLCETKTNSLKREPGKRVTSPKVRFEDDELNQHYFGQKDYLDCIRAVVVSFLEKRNDNNKNCSH